MYKIKKDDVVIVIAGKDKGKNGQVLSVDHKNKKILVKGVNVVKKHQKAGKTKGATESGIIERENWIAISNVMLSIDGKATRVGFKVEGDKKVRVAKKTGKVIK
ncbi:MAG: 50S ribosomal protein L24 [Lachnospiraceae bacterium]|jgi:large subunit ribosomal protein L24|nr:50S ribosomal protein L24 [Lachnospiraceae bacterium]